MFQLPIRKFGLSFRLVETSDAEFIVNLRLHPQLTKFLSKTDENIETQIEWIKNYKKREVEGKEYYFIFEEDNTFRKPLGVIRLYNFKNDTYTSGSWLITPDADEFIALKSDLFAAYFAFEILKFNQCFIDVRKDNIKVLRYHRKFFKQVDEDDDCFYFLMGREEYEKKKTFLLSIINN